MIAARVCSSMIPARCSPWLRTADTMSSVLRSIADSTLLELTANGELILADGTGNGYRFAELGAANNPSGSAGVLKVKTACWRTHSAARGCVATPPPSWRRTAPPPHLIRKVR